MQNFSSNRIGHCSFSGSQNKTMGACYILSDLVQGKSGAMSYVFEGKKDIPVSSRNNWDILRERSGRFHVGEAWSRWFTRNERETSGETASNPIPPCSLLFTDEHRVTWSRKFNGHAKRACDNLHRTFGYWEERRSPWLFSLRNIFIPLKTPRKMMNAWCAEKYLHRLRNQICWVRARYFVMCVMPLRGRPHKRYHVF